MQAKNRNKKTISEKKELDGVSVEAATFLMGLNKRGYALLPSGSFLGSHLNIGYQVVKITKPRSKK